MIRVFIPARLEYLGLLRAAVQHLDGPYQGQAKRPTPEMLYAWGLAIYEAGTNVVLHGYDGGGPDLLCLAIETRPDKVVFQLEDAGRPNEQWDTHHPSSPWDERGRGLEIIRRVMQEATYERNKDGKNVLRLVAELANRPTTASS